MKQKTSEIKKKYNIYITKGIKFAHENEIEVSQSFFLKAIKLDKTNKEGHINLANTYLIKNNVVKCLSTLSNYIFNIKYETSILVLIFEICSNYKLNSKFIKISEQILSNLKIEKEELKMILYYKGISYEKLHKYNVALNLYKKSISLDINFFDSYLKIFELAESTNKLEILNKYINLGLRIFKEDKLVKILTLYKSILKNRDNKFSVSQEIISNHQLIEEFKNSKKYYPKLLDLEAKNNEKLKNYHLAFEKINLRNNILLQLDENKKYDKNKVLDTIKKYKKFFIKSNLKSINTNLTYVDDAKLVFLVGFPRSGTTLLDTILRTHSKIKVLEEKPYLLNLRHDYFKKNNNNLLSLKNLDQQNKDYIRNEYYKKIISNDKDKNKIIIDKFPLSIIEIGFIKCIFPEAKIIFALRNPYDVVISCFFSSFKINDAMINFLDWNDTITFYNEVLDLFDNYTKEFEINYIEVKYENIVKNFKKEVNKILMFLNLDYESKLENFFITAKKRSKISTPSYNQVINPLYHSSIGRWKNYKNIKGIKFKLDRWIKEFRY